MSLKRGSWIQEIRGSLPASGEASIIVTTPEGVEYIPLSREVIDADSNAIKSAQRWYSSITACCVVFAATLAGYHFLKLSSMETNILRLTHELAAVSAPLSRLSEELPEFAVSALNANEADLAGTIEAMKDLITLQDESFRFYVESTRVLLDRDQQALIDELSNFGLIAEESAGPQEISAIGGFATIDSMGDLLSYYVQDPLLEMLNERAETLQLVDSLPTARPMQNSILTSRYGMRRHPISGKREAHQGIDLVSYTNSEVHSAAPGVVKTAGINGGLGKAVTIDHGNNVTTVFAHLSKIHVKPGDKIELGQVIGIMGNTGNSTAKHLHYEVRIDGKPIDPLRLIGKFNHVL